MSTQIPSDDGRWQHERQWLGYAGLIPFLACLAVLLLAADPAPQRVAVDTLRYYAALIASFLGAVHWGAAGYADDGLARARLRWGVVPALIAWTLLALPATAALIGFALLFGLILVVDRYLLPLLDAAYRGLRLRLSGVAVIALLLAAVRVPGGLS